MSFSSTYSHSSSEQLVDFCVFLVDKEQEKMRAVVQVDGGQEQDILRQQVERFRAVIAILFPPFEPVPGHVLWVLYGWLEPWFSPRHSTGEPQGALDVAGSLKRPEAAGEDVKGDLCSSQDRAAASDVEREVSCTSGIPAQHGAAVAGPSVTACLLSEGGSERWRMFAVVLHDMVAAAGKGHAQMLQAQQEEHSSEVSMLRDTIAAHKV